MWNNRIVPVVQEWAFYLFFLVILFGPAIAHGYFFGE